MDTPTPAVPRLVFDGDCGFCTTSATWVADRLHRDGGPDALLVPWQFTDLSAIQTTVERAQREVLWVEPDGTLYGGAEAFARWFVFRGGPYALLGTALMLPPIRQLAAVVYRLVARNRQRMPGGTPACALPPPGATPGPTSPQPGS